jgi:hypothetical protein
MKRDRDFRHPVFDEARAAMRVTRHPQFPTLISVLNYIATPFRDQQIAGLESLDAILTKEEPPVFSQYISRMTFVPLNILQIAVETSDPAILRSALRCLARICLFLRPVKSFIQCLSVSDTVDFLISHFSADDFEIVNFAAVILSYASFHVTDIAVFLHANGVIDRIEQLPSNICYGRLIFSLIKPMHLRNSLPVDRIRPILSRMIMSETAFNVRFALKSYFKLAGHPDCEPDFEGLPRVLGNLLEGKSDLIRIWSLKLLQQYDSLPSEVLLMIYSQSCDWNPKCAILGFDILARHIDLFMPILSEFNIDLILHAIVDGDLKVKRSAFHLLLMVNDITPLTDLRILEPLFALIGDEKCTEAIMNFMTNLQGVYENSGRMEEFIDALSSMEDQLDDLQLSPNDAVVEIASSLSLILSTGR